MPEQQTSIVRVEVDYAEQPSTAYANYVSISHSPTELFIDFCLVAPPYTVEPDNSIKVRAFQRLVIPVQVGAGVVEALRAQLAKLAEEHEAQQFPEEIGE